FSMVNMVKPGTFPFGAMAEFETPGLTLFAQLDGQAGDPGRLEELLGTAHSLANDLGGELRDDRRQPLTAEGEERLRQRVMAFITHRMAE
nr:cell division protein ZipA [Chromatiaceae bacterium]